MRVDLLTAVSINGLVTMGRGRSSYDLIEHLPPIAPEFWAVKAEIRRRHDAVLIGTNTVLTNDPTMASHGSPDHPVVRATLDRTGRIPRHFRFFDGSVRTLIGVTATTPPDYLRFLEERGVEAVPCGTTGMTGEESQTDLCLFLDGLEAKGIRSMVCEGGGILNRALLDQGLVGDINVSLLPVILDGGSVNLFEGPGLPVPLRLEGVERVWDAVVLRYRVSP